ncbi:MAG: type II toxin-antitoxin system VapC family toxin [Actinomycetota bacterium]
MIVDTSALVAIVMREDGHEELLNKLTRGAAPAGVGAPTLAELGLVLTARLGSESQALVYALVDHLDLAVVPFGDAHWQTAIQAFRHYGRGRHRAALNFGDCLTYAVASLSRESLLFVGDDFSHTDLVPA